MAHELYVDLFAEHFDIIAAEGIAARKGRVEGLATPDHWIEHKKEIK